MDWTSFFLRSCATAIRQSVILGLVYTPHRYPVITENEIFVNPNQSIRILQETMSWVFFIILCIIEIEY